MHKKGMTLIEILVSSMIFALIISGLIGVFVMTRGHNLHSRARLTASELEKSFLDPLNTQVDASDWSTNCLGAGNCPNVIENIDGRAYNANYTVSDIDILNLDPFKLKRVTVNITWNEE